MKPKLFEAMNQIKQEGNRDSVLLLLTDIIQEGSQLLVLSDEPSSIEEAFDITLQDNQAWLPKVMSRKKQVIPNLQKVFV
jgi:manganese-dependent inorganic pyrophosphatase